MAKSNTNTGGVVVACKLPHGLHLDVNNQRITLNGGNSDTAVGGYGLTENVDAELYTEWAKQNAQHPALKNNQIFLSTNAADAKAQADEQSEIKTGFEGIDTKNLPAGIETADTQKKIPG